MKAYISDDSDESAEIMMVDNLDDDLSSKEASQTRTKENQFNVNARRRIEEYLERKSLDSQTSDFYFSD